MCSNSTTSAISSASLTAIPSSTAVTSTFSAPTPTYTPLSDCPASNNTRYISSFAAGTSGSVTSGTGLNFTKYCDLESPLTTTNARTISEAFVYSFSDCIEVCAGYNFWAAGSNCTVAVYQPTGTRPGNCWVGSVSVEHGIGGLSVKEGMDVALLTQ